MWQVFGESQSGERETNVMTTTILIGFLAMGSSTLAAAQDDGVRGFYLGAGAGGSNVTVENYSNNDCCYYGYEYDTGEAAASFSLHSGYRFGPHVAVELGYVDAGKSKWDEQFAYIEDLNDFYNNDVELDLQSAQLSVLGILPFAGIWEGYVKLGAAYWWADAEQRLVSTFDGSVVQRSVDDGNLDILVGIGIGVGLGPDWRLRLEYQTFGIEKELLNAANDSTLDSVLFELQFRPRRS